MVITWGGLASDNDVISCTVAAFGWRDWETAEKLNSWSLSRYLPPEYEAGVLTVMFGINLN
jgi:hypothetical protein